MRSCSIRARLSLTFLALSIGVASAGEIRIGDINSYSNVPEGTEPYRKGVQMAVDEVNAKGGINGQKLVVLTKDDAGRPATAINAANDLITNEQVAMITGGYFSTVGLALADFAKQKKVFYLATEPLTDAIVWSQGNDYTFRLRPSTYMQADMLVDRVANLPAKRWATVAPNFEFGQSIVAIFKDLLKKKRPDVEFVGEQWPPAGKIDAGAVVSALENMKPDAIFNANFGTDLIKFVREGNTRGLFKNRLILSPLTGEPEYIDPLKEESPVGWYVSGYPWYAIDIPAHRIFLDAYEARYHDYPRVGSVVGYTMVKSVEAILKKAGSTDTQAMIAAAKGIQVDMPFGRITYRAVDHQSTMGAFVGTTTVRDGKGVMIDFKYEDGAAHLPSEEATRKLRPQG